MKKTINCFKIVKTRALPMCAIGGILSQEFNKKFIYRKLALASSKMLSRGPDAQSFWINQKLKMGVLHNRLKILDLSNNANQPFFDQNKNIMILFNGEIYNYKELKQQHFSMTHFFSDSDTEVVLKMYEKFGIEMLSLLEGMFALAIFDFKKEKLFLIRDRFGIKPLYFSISQKSLAFASQLNGLEALLEQETEPSLLAIHHFIITLAIPAPLTKLKNCYKVPSGHYLEIDFKEYTKAKFINWYPIKQLFCTSKTKPSEEKIFSILKTSIIKHSTTSDVPLGIFLSSGIDSSIIACISAQVRTNITAYHLDLSKINGKNEIEAVTKLTKEIGINLKIITPSKKDIFLASIELLERIDDLIGDPVSVALFLLCKAASADGCKVILSGEGADELFWGYKLYFKHLHFEKITQWIPNFIIKMIKSLPFSPYKKYVLERKSDNLFSFLSGAINPIATKLLKRHLHKNIKMNYKEESELINSFCKNNQLQQNILDSSTWQNINYLAPETQISILEFSHRLPELILMRCDKVGMLFGIEIRVPFLDHNLVESIATTELPSISSEQNTKFILRKILHLLTNNEKLSSQEKIGFNTPSLQSENDLNKLCKWIFQFLY